MKMADAKSPQLDQKWWSKKKPRSLKPTGLGKAIAAYQTAKGNLKPGADPKAIDEVKKKLKELAAVRAKAENMAAKDASKHKETLEALKNYQKLITKEDQQLAGMVKDQGTRDKTHKDVLKIFDKLKLHCRGVTEELRDQKKDIEEGNSGFSDRDYVNLAFKQLKSLTEFIKKSGGTAIKKWKTEVERDATKQQLAEFKKCQDEFAAVAKWPADALKNIKNGGNLPQFPT